ncbi:MAG: hypothetical protein OEV44_02410 [Spirochaetota bacterium]|nr:hypothetical protein [Spirochaetota bacterium]
MSEIDNINSGSRQPAKQEESPRATTVLVLGILSIVVCGVCGIIALVMGNTEFKLGYPKTGSLYAGWVMGLIGTILMGVGIIILIIVLALGVTIFGEAMKHMPR